MRRELASQAFDHTRSRETWSATSSPSTADIKGEAMQALIYLALGVDALDLTSGRFADGLTAPELTSDAEVRHPHRQDGNKVGDQHDNDVVAGRQELEMVSV